MSTLYFHAENDGAELRGAERHWAGRVTTDFGLAGLGLTAHMFAEEHVRMLADAMKPRPSTGFGSSTEALTLALSVRADEYAFVTPDGVEHNAWTVLLNTCIAAGSDALRFLARLHAQCELHAWVDGPDRAWLAGVIDEGRGCGLLRDGVCWESVTEMLRRSDAGPVVMSFSVTESFPNRHIAEWKPPVVDGEPQHDAWYALPEEERWRLAMIGLRKQLDLQLSPENFRAYGFGTGMNGFQLTSALRKTAAERAAAQAPKPAPGSLVDLLLKRGDGNG